MPRNTAKTPHSQEDLQTLIDATPGIHMLLDLSGKILAINQAGLDHFTLREEEALGLDAFSITPAEVLGRRQQVFQQAISLAQPLDYEDHHHGRYFAFRVIPIKGTAGTVTRVAVFAEDITARREISRRLTQSEAKYRFLAENAGDIVWQLDDQMRFTYVSPSSEHIRGYTEEDLLGQQVFSLYTPEGLQIVRRAMAERDERCRRGEQVISICFESPQQRKDGSVIWTETTSTRIVDEQGQLIGYVGITRDVDERRRAREALEAANRELRLRLEENASLQDRLMEMAIRDALTGAYNRHFLDEALPAEFTKALRASKPLSVVLLDVDHFKQINDSLGHHAGDQVLRELAGILLGSARHSDVICRWGGEEFLVVLPGMTLAQACQRAEKWRQDLAAHIFNEQAVALCVTASFGCASINAPTDSVNALLQRADSALYQSKNGGRNCVTPAD